MSKADFVTSQLKEIKYRAILREKLLERKKRNSNYSLRSYARDLKLSSAFLSQVLSGKKRLSFDRAIGLAEKLDWESSEEKQSFINSVRVGESRSEIGKDWILEEWAQKFKKTLTFHRLPNSSLQTLSSWEATALLEFLELDDFNTSAVNLKKRIGLPKKKLLTALEELKQLNLIEESNGIFKKNHRLSKWPSFPNKTIRKIHTQYMELAQRAIETQSTTERDISGTVLTISEKKYQKYTQLIQNFRSQILELSEEEPSRDAVYRLSVQFFRLDKKEN